VTPLGCRGVKKGAPVYPGRPLTIPLASSQAVRSRNAVARRVIFSFGRRTMTSLSLPKTPSGGVAAVDESQHNCG
jgi:hypothetical protein